jgi:uncharacterized protein YfiM (DUF2279 family)
VTPLPVGELVRAALVCMAVAAPSTGVPAAAPVIAAPQPADLWLGADKFRHAGMSFAITAYGYGAARAAGADRGAALYIALPVAAAAGVGKEIHDHRRGGVFSIRDLVADAVGVAAAWLFLREVR